jgi:hypothetical protein
MEYCLKKTSAYWLNFVENFFGTHVIKPYKFFWKIKESVSKSQKMLVLLLSDEKNVVSRFPQKKMQDHFQKSLCLLVEFCGKILYYAWEIHKNCLQNQKIWNLIPGDFDFTTLGWNNVVSRFIWKKILYRLQKRLCLVDEFCGKLHM